MEPDDQLQIAEKLLLAVKMNNDVQPWIEKLVQLDLNKLQLLLDEDGKKKAFWINIYNAWFLILRKHRKVEKSIIYKTPQIEIAGEQFSLDEVEHGILRKYRYKFSLGYLPNPFARNLIKKLAVHQIDYRIHFALNCGVKSCPPIAFYSAPRIEQQLEMATLAFLEGETEVDEQQKEIRISRLMKWYHGDFGGNSGIRKMLEEKLKLTTKGFRLVYKDYSWEEDLENFVELS